MSRYRLKWESGTYKRRCDKSGFNFKRNELVREPQTGLLVHPHFSDQIHPSDIPFIFNYDKPRIE